MNRQMEVQGVPRRLAQDGWWLAAGPEAGAAAAGGPAGAPPLQAVRPAGGAMGVLALVVLADLLFWRATPGLSLAIYAAAVVGLAGLGRPRADRLRAGLVLAIGVAPVVEHVQALSIGFLVAGVALALVLQRGAVTGGGALVQRALGLLVRLPSAWAGLLRPRRWWAAGGGGQARVLGVLPAQAVRDWAFPVGGSMVFLALLVDANPLIGQLGGPAPDPVELVLRAVFWLGMAVLVTPFLARDLPEAVLPAGRGQLRMPGLGINTRSVLRALGLFNLLIGVQVASDLAILWGGAALPAGMTYAEYAHRGAYPLLATAMLAGAFALAAKPFWGEHRLIRPLMLVWLLQNMVVTGAAALRLELYIEAYGQTLLRIHAQIWMALVGAGLALVAWQVLRRLETLWLMVRLAGLGIGTLYLASFINFAGVVAAENLARPEPDLDYVCALGPMAAGELAAAGAARPWLLAEASREPVEYWDVRCAALKPPRIDSWQEWGFRSWRVIRKVEVVTVPERPA